MNTRVTVQPVIESSATVTKGVTGPQLSVALTSDVTESTVGSVDGLQPRSPPAGTTLTGGVVSLTLIVCVYETSFPHSSVAVQVLVMTLLQELPGLDWASVKVTSYIPH